MTGISASSVINITMSFSIQHLWGLINALQLIVFTCLFNLKTPFNAETIEIAILKMVSFDVLDTESKLKKMFKFKDKETPALNYKFDTAGFGSSNFILLMGTNFIT
jgi:hypothetical protein